MPWGNWVALFFITIMLFLLLSNGRETVAVMNALGGQATALTGALQGRGVTNAGVTLSAPTNTGFSGLG